MSKSSEYDASEQWSQDLQGFAWGIAAIAILIGGLGMMNAMTAMLQRHRHPYPMAAICCSSPAIPAVRGLIEGFAGDGRSAAGHLDGGITTSRSPRTSIAATAAAAAATALACATARRRLHRGR